MSYLQYAEDVRTGRIQAGESIRQAVKRFCEDLEREDLEFRSEVVDNAIEFI